MPFLAYYRVKSLVAFFLTIFLTPPNAGALFLIS